MLDGNLKPLVSRLRRICFSLERKWICESTRGKLRAEGKEDGARDLQVDFFFWNHCDSKFEPTPIIAKLLVLIAPRMGRRKSSVRNAIGNTCRSLHSGPVRVDDGCSTDRISRLRMLRLMPSTIWIIRETFETKMLEIISKKILGTLASAGKCLGPKCCRERT